MYAISAIATVCGIVCQFLNVKLIYSVCGTMCCCCHIVCNSAANLVNVGHTTDSLGKSYHIWREVVEMIVSVLHASRVTKCVTVKISPLPSNRHHRSSGDCLEGKGENCQVCSVQYCVQQLCTMRCTHI